MAVIVQLRTQQDQIVPMINGVSLGIPISEKELPTVDLIREDPERHGRILFHALGGEVLLKHIANDTDNLLLIEADETADTAPWEFATLPNGKELLVEHYGLLRLVSKETFRSPVTPIPSLNFILLISDPLMDQHEQLRDATRSQFEKELATIQQVVKDSGKAVVARRIPPTRAALQKALRRGPTWLHVIAHGEVVMNKHRPVAVFYIENINGEKEPLRGPELVKMAPPGTLLLVVLSACHTATGSPQTRLVRALVLNGVPAAVGMQGRFPDNGYVFAEAFYDSLLLGHNLAESLRQARIQLRQDLGVTSAGLPVAYVAHKAWLPIEFPAGLPNTKYLFHINRTDLSPQVPHLMHIGVTDLPPILLKRHLKGRRRELYEIASLYDDESARVVTLTGPLGIGKTALAAAFAHRFAWRWPQGVIGLSFADVEQPDATTFRCELLRRLLDVQKAQRLANADPAKQEQVILDTLRTWDGLLLVDSYETVLQALKASDPEAQAIHRLLHRVADGGQPLLLTSREHPASLPNEQPYPAHGLSGLSPEAGADLFLAYSSSQGVKDPALNRLAQRVSIRTGGHPLSIILLASRFAQQKGKPDSLESFLDDWPAELEIARQPGLSPRHETFAKAFEISYHCLDPVLQKRLRLLSVFSFPFFPEAAAFAWGFVNADGNPLVSEEVRDNLSDLARYNWLVRDTTKTNQIPERFYFLPVIQAKLQSLATNSEKEQQDMVVVLYKEWLSKHKTAASYLSYIHKCFVEASIALAQFHLEHPGKIPSTRITSVIDYPQISVLNPLLPIWLRGGFQS